MVCYSSHNKLGQLTQQVVEDWEGKRTAEIREERWEVAPAPRPEEQRGLAESFEPRNMEKGPVEPAPRLLRSGHSEARSGHVENTGSQNQVRHMENTGSQNQVLLPGWKIAGDTLIGKGSPQEVNRKFLFQPLRTPYCHSVTRVSQDFWQRSVVCQVSSRHHKEN